jgi:hypothetical protein
VLSLATDCLPAAHRGRVYSGSRERQLLQHRPSLRGELRDHGCVLREGGARPVRRAQRRAAPLSRTSTEVFWSSVVRMGMPSALITITPCTPARAGRRTGRSASAHGPVQELHPLPSSRSCVQLGRRRTRVAAHALQRLLHLCGSLRESARPSVIAKS